METRRLRLLGKQKEFPIQIVAPGHFTCEDAGSIEPHAVLLDPRFTLYCFDPANRAALFVETPHGVNLAEAAFYYMAQFERAVGLVSMPFETFVQLAGEVAMPTGGLVLVHSVGRCGSTLLSKALAAVPGVESLSEPDDLTQLLSHAGEPWLPDAVRASVRWRCKPRAGSPATHVAIKTRSEVMVIADRLCAAFPEASNLFLYRNGVDWARSVYRGARTITDVADVETNRQIQERWARILPLVAELGSHETPLNPVETRILAWAQCMEGYLDLHATAARLCALRYEDLAANPRRTLAEVFSFCHIDVDDWSPIEAVFGRDSQEGTIYDREELRKRERELPPELERCAAEMIARRPRLRTPDVILPDTAGR